MRPIVTSIEIAAPVDRVWAALAAVEMHSEWMSDATSIIFLSDKRTGVGTRVRVKTRFGPLRIDDDMEFTEWTSPNLMTVNHVGRIGGRGEFRLSENEGDRTTFTWVEDLIFPWYYGGWFGVAMTRPILRRQFSANLKRFADGI